ncbi:hypothetical protein [Wolbachia endosymbiont of Chironomus riparius]|uniref:hypothetical protein n=1 Tax=Wolbachia endosymbiont of Chironomus riparius TaxID=2883238 RepID=UPI00209D3812|nr:hypothetical protein [Wolbachia endosymbiont of Chironomus riparius]
MKYFNGKINLYSTIKNYLYIFFLLSVFTLGYSSINYLLEKNDVLISFTFKTEFLLIIGTALLLFNVIYEKSCNKKNYSEQDMRSCVNEPSSQFSKTIFLPSTPSTSVLEYVFADANISINNTTKSNFSSNSNESASTLSFSLITLFQELNLDCEINKSSTIKQTLLEIEKGLFLIGIAVLSCSFIVGILTTLQLFLPNIPDYVSNWLNSSVNILLILTPIIGLVGYCTFSKFQAISQEKSEVRNVSYTEGTKKENSFQNKEHNNNYKNDFLNPLSQPYIDNKTPKINSFQNKEHNNNYKNDFLNPLSQPYIGNKAPKVDSFQNKKNSNEYKNDFLNPLSQPYIDNKTPKINSFQNKEHNNNYKNDFLNPLSQPYIGNKAPKVDSFQNKKNSNEYKNDFLNPLSQNCKQGTALKQLTKTALTGKALY